MATFVEDWEPVSLPAPAAKAPGGVTDWEPARVPAAPKGDRVFTQAAPPMPRPSPRRPPVVSGGMEKVRGTGQIAAPASDPVNDFLWNIATEGGKAIGSIPLDRAGNTVGDAAAQAAGIVGTTAKGVGALLVPGSKQWDAARAVIEAAKTGFGDQPFISPEDEETLRQWGIFGPGVVQQINEAFMRPLITAGSSIPRAFGGAISAASETARQIAIAGGADESDANRAAREVGGLLEAEFARRMGEAGQSTAWPVAARPLRPDVEDFLYKANSPYRGMKNPPWMANRFARLPPPGRDATEWPRPVEPSPRPPPGPGPAPEAPRPSPAAEVRPAEPAPAERPPVEGRPPVPSPTATPPVPVLRPEGTVQAPVRPPVTPVARPSAPAVEGPPPAAVAPPPAAEPPAPAPRNPVIEAALARGDRMAGAPEVIYAPPPAPTAPAPDAEAVAARVVDELRAREQPPAVTPPAPAPPPPTAPSGDWQPIAPEHMAPPVPQPRVRKPAELPFHPDRLPRRPIIQMLKAAGGVDPTSPLAGELRHAGATFRSAPGLYRRGGLRAADNFVASEYPIFENTPFPADENGYIPQDAIIEGVRRDLAGDPLRSPDDMLRIADWEKSQQAAEEGAGIASNRSAIVDMLKGADIYTADDPFIDQAALILHRGEASTPELAYERAVDDIVARDLDHEDRAAINERAGEPILPDEPLGSEAEARVPEGRDRGERTGEDSVGAPPEEPAQSSEGLPQRGEAEGAAPARKPLDGEISTPADQYRALVAEEVRESIADGSMDQTGNQTALDAAIVNVKDMIAQGDVAAPNGAKWADVLDALRMRQRIEGRTQVESPAPPMRTETVKLDKGTGEQGQMFSPKETAGTAPKQQPKAPQKDADEGLFAKPKPLDEQREMFAASEKKPEVRRPPPESAKPPETKTVEKSPGVTGFREEPPTDYGNAAPVFYSAVLRAVEDAKLSKGTAAQWSGYLKNRPGVKPDELKWLDVEGWLTEQTGTITRDELADYVRRSQVEIVDAVSEPGKTRYTPVLQNGERYRELRLRLPGPQIVHSHWQEPDVLVHVRFDERRDIRGQRTLMIHEIQSDWLQQGRSLGFGPRVVPVGAAAKERFATLSKKLEEAESAHRDLRQEIVDRASKYGGSVDTQSPGWWGRQYEAFPDLSVRANELYAQEEALKKEMRGLNETNQRGVPDAPLKSSSDWGALALKRMIRWATDNGFDQIAWTTGATQVRHTGNEGLRTFYDTVLVKAANKLAKGFDTSVGSSRVKIATLFKDGLFALTPEAKVRVHTLPLSEPMRAAARKGFALFEEPVDYAAKPPVRNNAPAQKPNGTDKFGRPQFTHYDLGEFPKSDSAPLGAQAQDAVVALGRANDREFLAVFDAEGKTITWGYGGQTSTGMPPALNRALNDPKQSVVAHHNHPSDSSFSSADVGLLAAPGLHSLWAHGHDGSIYRANLNANARLYLRSLNATDHGVSRMVNAHARANRQIYDLIDTYVESLGRTPQAVNEAVAYHSHLVSTVLNRAGIIDYTSNVEAGAFVAKLGLAPYIRDIASTVQAEFYLDAASRPELQHDRRPEPLRHPGEVGTTFARRDPAAIEHGWQGRLAARSKALDQGQEARDGARQLSLPGFGEDRAPVFYSAALRATEGAKIDKGTPDQWLATIRNTPGVKPEELEWLGIAEWLKDQTGTITKADVADFIRANQIEVRDVVKGERQSLDAKDERYSGDLPKFASYQLPGGENYRELLLTLPPKVSFDPAKVRIERSVRSTTQGETTLYYDGKKVGTFSDDPQLTAGGRYEQRSEAHWIDVMRRRFGGDQTAGVKPLDAGVNYRSPHFDEPNVVAHVRFNDRFTSADGTSYTPPRRMLFIEEIQSDWHQAGRKRGYATSHPMEWSYNPDLAAWVGKAGQHSAVVKQIAPGSPMARQMGPPSQNGWVIIRPSNPTPDRFFDSADAAMKAADSTVVGVPDAPFKTTWPELALKRMIRWAAENGYDQVAWTPGDVQAARYDLSKHVDEISVSKGVPPARLHVRLTSPVLDVHLMVDEKGTVIRADGIGAGDAAGKALDEVIGKALADKVMSHEGSGVTKISGPDLAIGGEGMKGFYDKILVTAANKLGKKFGAKVGAATVIGRDAPFVVVKQMRDLGREEDVAAFSTRSAAEAHAEGLGGGARVEERGSVSVHSLPITDAMREAATSEGFAIFEEPPPDYGGPPPANARENVLSRIGTERGKRWPTFAKLYEMLKDDLDPIKRAVKFATGGRRLRAARDPYVTARLARGTYGMAQHWIQHGTFRFEDRTPNGPSLKEILHPVHSDLDGLRAYAIARRSLELQDRGIETGIDPASARAVVGRGNRRFGDVFRDLVAYQDRALQYLIDAGILKPASAAAMREANLDYVPFYRVMDEEAGSRPGIGKPFTVRNPIRGIRGSGRQIIDPIESIIRNTFTMIDLAERNRVLRSFVDLAEATGERGKEIAEKVRTPVHPITVGEAEVRAFMRDNGIEGDAAEFTIFRPNALRPQPDMIAPFVNGKRVLYEVPEEIGAALQSLNREKAHVLFRILSAPARLLRAGATLAPEFIARNPFRDQFTAFILSDSGYKPFIDMIRGLGAVMRKNESYQEWLRSGGANSSLVSLDRDYIHDNLMRLEDAKFRERIGRVVKSPIRALRALSELTENATRVRNFERARRLGKSKAQSAIESREVTLDFARLGSKGSAINQIVAFWNAQVEGLDRVVRGFKAHPFRTLFRIALAITLPSIFLWWANHDDPRWKEIPQWERDLFWIILTDDWQQPKDEKELKAYQDNGLAKRKNGRWYVNKGNIWRVPKPFELGVIFGSVPERILDAFVDKEPTALDGLMGAVGLSLTPAYIPTVAIPFIEQFANWSIFLDRPIIPRSQEGVAPSEQKGDNTSGVADVLSKIITKIPGVGDSSFGSPYVIDNYIHGWTGGLGQYAVSIADAALRAAGIEPERFDPSPTIADLPLAKGFAVRFPASSLNSVTQFYEYWQKEMKRDQTYRFLLKQGDRERAQALGRGLATGPFGTGGQLGAVASTLSVQRKAVRAIYLDPKMPADEKRRLIDMLYLEMVKTAREGIERYNRRRAK